MLFKQETVNALSVSSFLILFFTKINEISVIHIKLVIFIIYIIFLLKLLKTNLKQLSLFNIEP